MERIIRGVRIHRSRNFFYNPLRIQGKHNCFRESCAGFTLVEIIIVVSILALLSALVIPNLLRSRIIANEAAALASCRAINTACQMFMVSQNTYPGGLNDLVPPQSTPAYIDSELASGAKQGYTFTYNRQDSGHFTLNADPVAGVLNPFQRYFFMDERGVIRFKVGSSAGVNDEILG